MASLPAWICGSVMKQARLFYQYKLSWTELNCHHFSFWKVSLVYPSHNNFISPAFPRKSKGVYIHVHKIMCWRNWVKHYEGALQDLYHLNPRGHYMYRQFNIQQFHVLPHTAVFMCFVWISEQTAIISLYSINWLVCVTETECVYCAVRTVSLYIIQVVLSL